MSNSSCVDKHCYSYVMIVLLLYNMTNKKTHKHKDRYKHHKEGVKCISKKEFDSLFKEKEITTIKHTHCSMCGIKDVPFINYSTKRTNTGKVYRYMQCRKCNNERRKKYYSENKEKCRQILYKSFKKHSQKQRARHALSDKLRKGLIKRPRVCEQCGVVCRTEAHHLSYEKNLNTNKRTNQYGSYKMKRFVSVYDFDNDILWLCRDCHAKEHKN